MQNEFEKARLQAIDLLRGEDDYGNSWIKWVHEGTEPAETQFKRAANIPKALLTGHCAKCTNLNGCWFLHSKMLQQPLHENCHCKKELIPPPIAGVTAIAECPVEKLVKYGFTKKDFLENNGYDMIIRNG